MDFFAVGCCVFHFPLTAKSGRKGSLLRLLGNAQNNVSFPFSIYVRLTKLVLSKTLKSSLARLFLNFVNCQDKRLPESLRMSLTFMILLFIKDKLKVGLPWVTIKLLFHGLLLYI